MPEEKITLKSFIEKFLQHAEIGKNQSQRTIINYRHYLKRFLEFAGEKFDIEKLTLGHVQNFRLHLNRLRNGRGDTLEVKTQNYHIIALRAFLKYLVKQDIQTLAPEKIELSKIQARSVEFLTRDELDRLFNEIRTTDIRGLRDRAILETLYSTGLRVSELAALNRKQIDLERREFMVRGKGRKPRIIFLSQRAAEHIKNYLEKRTDNFEPVFLNHHSEKPKALRSVNSNSQSETNNHTPGVSHKSQEDIMKGESRRLSTVSIERIVRMYALRAGLIKHVTAHTLRHSFATELLMNGADIRSVQEMLGHASITTTQVYTHLTNQRLKEVHEKFHNSAEGAKK